MTRVAVYSGSFDPITNGHMDILERGSHLFDKIYVCISSSREKKYLFDLPERQQLCSDALKSFSNIEVVSHSGLLVEFVKKVKAKYILRGLRSNQDFEYEKAMAVMNHKLYSDVETVLLMAGSEWSSLSSSLIKEVASHGGDISSFVPKAVFQALQKKF